MLLVEMHQEEVADVKSMIGSFDKSKVVADVKLGIQQDQLRQLHDWQYVGVKFTDDASHSDILRFIVRCQADEFVGVHSGYYVLFFE